MCVAYSEDRADPQWRLHGDLVEDVTPVPPWWRILVLRDLISMPHFSFISVDFSRGSARNQPRAIRCSGFVSFHQFQGKWIAQSPFAGLVSHRNGRTEPERSQAGVSLNKSYQATTDFNNFRVLDRRRGALVLQNRVTESPLPTSLQTNPRLRTVRQTWTIVSSSFGLMNYGESLQCWRKRG